MGTTAASYAAPSDNPGSEPTGNHRHGSTTTNVTATSPSLPSTPEGTTHPNTFARKDRPCRIQAQLSLM